MTTARYAASKNADDRLYGNRMSRGEEGAVNLSKFTHSGVDVEGMKHTK